MILYQLWKFYKIEMLFDFTEKTQSPSEKPISTTFKIPNISKPIMEQNLMLWGQSSNLVLRNLAIKQEIKKFK